MKYVKLTFVAAALWAIGPAYAQQEKEYNLKVTASELTVIGQALDQMPYGKVAPLLTKLQIQVNTQNQSPVKPEGGNGGAGSPNSKE